MITRTLFVSVCFECLAKKIDFIDGLEADTTVKSLKYYNPLDFVKPTRTFEYWSSLLVVYIIKEISRYIFKQSVDIIILR